MATVRTANRSEEGPHPHEAPGKTALRPPAAGLGRPDHGKTAQNTLATQTGPEIPATPRKPPRGLPARPWFGRAAIPGSRNEGEPGFAAVLLSLISYFQLFKLVAVVEGPVFCGQGAFSLARQTLDDRTSVCKLPRYANPETGTTWRFSRILWITHGLL